VKALALLTQLADVAVVISDLRMPSMNGTAFLAHARHLVPDAVRILLTGAADMESAIAAVNDGEIYRFLTKPCPSAQMLAAVQSAVDQHRIVRAERELLEKTLQGSVAMLMDVLALAEPSAFGRATRIKRLCCGIAVQMGMRNLWPLEVAAMLSQVGLVTLSPEITVKLRSGQPLTPAESGAVQRAPLAVNRLLSHIPRLEPVRSILSRIEQPSGDKDRTRTSESVAGDEGAQILRVALAFDRMDAAGEPPAHAVEVLRGRPKDFEARAVDALSKVLGTTTRAAVHEIRTGALHPQRDLVRPSLGRRDARPEVARRRTGPV